jgi:hypothetical protein
MAEAEVDQIAQRQRAVEAIVANFGMDPPHDVDEKNVNCSPTVPGRRRATYEACIGEVYLGRREAIGGHKKYWCRAIVKVLFRARAVD